MNEKYYISKLQECYSVRQKRNSSYSLRAYSRDLGLHASTLCQVMKGKRSLPFKSTSKVLQNLELSPKEKTLFMESLFRSKTSIDNIEIAPLDERFMLDESHFKIISEWEHYAVLELVKIEAPNLTLSEISKRFDITKKRTNEVIHNLLTAKLIKIEDEKIIHVHEDVKTTEDISSEALTKSHFETLEIGKNKLKEIEVEFRDFSSATVGIDLQKLPEAKTIIREFRQKMVALLRDGKKTDVFQLAIQFYPLTEIEKKEINNEKSI